MNNFAKLIVIKEFLSLLLKKLRNKGVIDIYLFGSALHSTLTEKSDIDIFVIIQPDVDKHNIHKQIHRISKKYYEDRLISPIILTKKELEFRKNLPIYKNTIENSSRIRQ